MRRRRILALLAAPLLARPLGAMAEQRVRHLVLVFPGNPDAAPGFIETVRRRLAEANWVDGRNLRIEVRGGLDDDPQHKLAREVVASQPDVILVGGAPVQALRQETQTIPIVFVSFGDPVGNGLVASLAHPGGNVTGFAHFDAPLFGKWLELLKQIAPNTTHVAGLVVPRVNFPNTWWRAVENAAPA
ncbi:MAG TPA: ABC transporter substrate binding protein, partial [Stellaceae bacterium]|nr:ABC transporter substrate binding protein [Stellaceae bacterium]